MAKFLGPTDFLSGAVTAGGVCTELGVLPQRAELPLGTPVDLALRTDDVTLAPEGV